VSVNTAGNLSSSNHLRAGTFTGVESVSGAITGADAGDYTFAGATGSYTVSPLVISAAASGVNKVYDGTTSDSSTLSVGGLISGDQVTFADAAANFSNRNVGVGITVRVTGIGIGGADAADYALNSTAATTTANITPATLTYNATAASRSAGQVPSGLSGSLTGFVPGDTQASDTTGTLLWTTTAAATSQAGPYVFIEAPCNAAALTLQPAVVPPTVASSPPVPQAALNGIAQLQADILMAQVASQPAAIGAGFSHTNEGASSGDEGTDMETRRKIGSMGASLRVISGGVRMPK
jgi:hypothetical protein